MGDPFSVAGTAVGIISLGIQTCQILYKYCSDFKSFPRDVELVQRQIKGLQGILEGLYEVKERLEIDNHVPSSQLNMALKECEETLHELQKMAEKRIPTSPSEGIQAKARVIKERALWSYKKEDLKEVQSSLARFQSNLSLALQCAGIDGALHRLEDLRSELGMQQQQVDKIEQTLNQGTEVLEMIRRDVASQNPTLSTIYNEIISLRAQLSEGRFQLRQLFGKTASPTDLDEDGNGILYAVLCLIQNLPYTDAVKSATSELLDTCFHEGVPFDEPDADGHYPVVHWQLRAESITFFDEESREGHIQTLFHLTQKVKSWSVVQAKMFEGSSKTDIALGRIEHVFFRRISDLLRLESCSEGLYEDCPLREAILRRSELDFVALMKSHSHDTWVAFHDIETIVLLLSWPESLSILFDHLSDYVSLEILEIALDYAVGFSSPASIAILLSRGVPATWATWMTVTDRLHDVREEDLDEKRTSLWLQICEIIASRIDRSHETIPSGSGHHDIVPTALSLYHAGPLTCISAESAWRAGHRELNLINPVIASERRPWYTYGTPLWTHASRLTWLDSYFDTHFNLLIWLLRHGADPFWMHPTQFTTPAHVLARSSFALTLSNDQWWKDTRVLLSSSVRDSCYCHCSQSGCSVVGCAVAKPYAWFPKVDEHRKTFKQILKKAFGYVFMLVENDSSTNWMAADILRVMTFEELSLTHTCCYPLHHRSSKESIRPSPEEAEEIHILERDDIDLLECVVAELEEEWVRYGKSFLTFMNKVWRPRMRKMHEDRQVDRASYQARLVSMGMNLEEQDQENDSDAESWGSWPDESEDADSEGWYTPDEETDET
ncbi:hypothetical protein yc1106_00130 [Curvularia clavata]|uniref:Azaphilone pigments biosynthesis cluster protein L N-terminal domain-containing protein n=1 Tax=Curvularia clavata TaxID=95742 RepID=A0A9Q8YZG8_CURCL|nr:hypothetical protein yc1106_00130 [Curvularia clavata]